MKQFTMPIIFWLMTIEDKKIREAAIRNLKKCSLGMLYDEVGSLSSAILDGFSWERSNEGFKYWYNFTITKAVEL